MSRQDILNDLKEYVYVDDHGLQRKLTPDSCVELSWRMFRLFEELCYKCRGEIDNA